MLLSSDEWVQSHPDSETTEWSPGCDRVLLGGPPSAVHAQAPVRRETAPHRRPSRLGAPEGKPQRPRPAKDLVRSRHGMLRTQCLVQIHSPVHCIEGGKAILDRFFPPGALLGGNGHRERAILILVLVLPLRPLLDAFLGQF